MRNVIRLVQWIVGWSVAIPFIWNINGAKDWALKDSGVPEGLTYLIVLALGFMGTRAIALMTSHPDAWRDDGSFNHTARVKQYREAALKGMTSMQGAELLRDTAALDIPDEFGPDSATGRARRAMDAKFAGMTPAAGIEWLRGGKKK